MGDVLRKKLPSDAAFHSPFLLDCNAPRMSQPSCYNERSREIREIVERGSSFHSKRPYFTQRGDLFVLGKALLVDLTTE